MIFTFSVHWQQPLPVSSIPPELQPAMLSPGSVLLQSGFMVRPFGALFFGRMGDLLGRKFTYVLTIAIMGSATFIIGLLPTKEVLGVWAGVILIILRILQGLALGGQYGGAATFVAEHAPQGKRGFYTSWIQTTATLGLFLSLGIILVVRVGMGEETFNDWGWRIPFMVSILLVILSVWIRQSLRESPLYQQMKVSKTISKNPLKESFTNPYNLKWVLIALFGATMGQGVVWYTGQFYALFYLQQIFKVSLVESNIIVGAALVLSAPFFVFFGWLSDKVGRKKIMLGGMLLAVLTYYPIYGAMAAFAPIDTGQHFLFGYQGYNMVVSVGVGLHTGYLCYHGIRTYCRLLSRVIPDQDTLYLYVIPVSHR